MAHEHDITFGPFRLEMPHGGLWRGAQSIALRPRSRAMLRSVAQDEGDAARVLRGHFARGRNAFAHGDLAARAHLEQSLGFRDTTSLAISKIAGYCWRTPKSRNFHPVFSFFAHREIGKPRVEAPSLEDGKRFATSIRSFLRRNLEMTCLLRIWAEHCACLEVQGRLLVSQYNYGYAMLRMVQTRKMLSDMQTGRE